LKNILSLKGRRWIRNKSFGIHNTISLKPAGDVLLISQRKTTDSESEDSEQEEGEDEVMPTPKKRGAPVARASAAPVNVGRKAAAKKETAKKKAVAKKETATAPKLPVAKKSRPAVTARKSSGRK
jgi:hypothetical protein